VSETAFEIVVTGDLVLDEPDSDYWLSGIAPALRDADLAIAHLEVPHSRSGVELKNDVPAPGAPPENIAAIPQAGIRMVSLAGNHIADCGAAGIADTIDELDAVGVLHAGAGMNLDEARRPAVAFVDGRRISLLSYNCVGPEAGWAARDRAGCAYLPMQTGDGSPVSPQSDIVGIAFDAFDILAADIAQARQSADVVIVAMHKGLVHVPVRLAPYERAVARAAIDAGADVIVGHHAHIARGIEYYRDRPIFHGLGNGCVVTRALSPDQAHPLRREWAERRKRLFGFEPDPAFYLAPFHPQARNAFLGRVSISRDGSIKAGILPVDVDPPGRPVMADPRRAQEIARYLERITAEAAMHPISIDADGLIAEAV
jgi:poly-gamma-glutamate synthesis protein (capsule biosynthesis protein)